MTKYVIGLVALILLVASVGSYNGLVKLSQAVDSSWAQVETQYQRRLDLIPNLVSTVKGEADFEKSTLTDVVNARAKATSITVDANTVNNPQQFAKYQQAQSELGSTLSRLMMVSERYPDLKSNQQFAQLMDELAGTENRIATSRRDYNNNVQQYNTTVQTLPTLIMARIGGFTIKPYFQADAQANVAPSVDFSK